MNDAPRRNIEPYTLMRYNHNLLFVSDIEVLEDKIALVNQRPATFTIIAGPSRDQSKYILEIHYRESELTHRRLPGAKGSSPIYQAFAEQAAQVALDFCRERKLVIKPINCWPEYQAIVRKKNNLTKFIIPE